MAHANDFDVIICGSGPAGLTLAIDLARRNVSFALIDKAPHPFIGSRGKGIQARTEEVYEDLGVIDKLVATGGIYPIPRNYMPEGPVDKPDGPRPEPTPSEPYQIPLLVPQNLTERRLRERLAEFGHAPEYNCELVGFEQDADGVTARIATPHGEQVLRAAYLVGADGGSSFVRRAAGIEFPGKSLDVRSIVADVKVDGLSWEYWHRWGMGAPKQALSLCPLYGSDRLFQLMAMAPDGDVDLSAEGLTAVVRKCSDRDDLVVTEVAWASVYTMQARLAEAFQRGRVLLTGDAAHCHPPTGAQGLNTSIQDAYNLGWKLAAVLDGAPESLLATYEEERRPIAEGVLRMTKQLLDAAKNRGESRRGREVSQLDLGYRDSSLSLAGTERDKGVSPGDRAPDAPVTGAGGLPTRLFRLFQGTHWTLVGYEPGGSRIPEPRKGLHIHVVGGDILDTGGHFQNAYGLSPQEWVLVRPDGYVAAVSHDPGVIEAYLDGVGVNPVQ